MSSVLQYPGLSQRLALDTAKYLDPNNNGNKAGLARGDKYSLRPRSSRRDDDDSPIPTKSKSRGSKPKQKAAPLSKYRRKTANARERSRMREINTAFETLRRAVPHWGANPHPGSNPSEKLTKITTLRLAMKYISALTSALKDQSSGVQRDGLTPSVDLGDLFSDCSDLDCLFLESDGESLQLHSDMSDHSLTPAELTTDFPNHSISPVDFGDSLSPVFPDQTISPFDTFFTDFS